jgi:hypothetical protein
LATRLGAARARRAGGALIALAFAFAASGCAVDNRGAVIGRITHADGALVADLYSVGIHLKTRAGDAGLVLGYSRTSYVFARSMDDAQIAENWHTFAVPLPAASPKVLHLESAGVSAHRNHGLIGLTVGYRAYTILARAHAASHEGLSVTYRPDQPSHTRMRNCEGSKPCKEMLWR